MWKSLSNPVKQVKFTLILWLLENRFIEQIRLAEKGQLFHRLYQVAVYIGWYACRRLTGCQSTALTDRLLLMLAKASPYVWSHVNRLINVESKLSTSTDDLCTIQAKKTVVTQSYAVIISCYNISVWNKTRTYSRYFIPLRGITFDDLSHLLSKAI